MSTCPTCAEPLAAGARFCPGCGTPTREGELAATPIQWQVAEPRYFGVAPATLLFGIVVAAVVLAIVLFVTSHWPLGLICVGVALLALAGFLELARRKPDARVARVTGEALWTLRQRTEAAMESLSVRSHASRQLMAIRRELRALERAREERLLYLGYAVYRGDDAATASLRAALREIDDRAAWLEAEAARIGSEAEARVQQARLQVQPTEMVDLPEPYPPPDEGTPPTPAPVPEPSPAPVPEPYPPPDEGSPPAPPQVPEPGPGAPGR